MDLYREIERKKEMETTQIVSIFLIVLVGGDASALL